MAWSFLDRGDVVDDKEYFTHPAISYSKLKVFRQSRKKYKAMYVDRTLQQEPTDSMQLGSAVHCLTLEPHSFDVRYAVAPKVDRRTNIGKATWSEFCEASEGKTVLDADTYRKATNAANAIKDNRAASQLLALPGFCERPLMWKHPNVFGVECKAKLDKVTGAAGIIFDIKTTQDATPAQFARTIASYGYDGQAAWYSEGFEAEFGDWPTFIFIAVQTDAPYEVGLYELSQDDLTRACEENEHALRQLVECETSGDWLQPHERDVVKLALPGYARFRNEYQF
jgi:exodeoxyribonuclease VIII